MTSTVNGSSAALPGRGALAVAEGSRPAGQPARVPQTRRPRFLQDKLQVPEPSFAILHRRRVSGLLDEAIRHRVTLVCGPAGAGKTVACASWATSGHPAGPVAWVTLDADDHRDWFWAYVSAALRRVPAVPEQAIEALADTLPERFPLRLVEVAQAFSQPLVLVLDGVHEISDPGLLTGLDVLIKHAPPGLRLVMLARRPPALQLARLRVAGELADIGGPELACTADEADAYFGLLGLRVAAAERNEVLRRTEGWMAGLRLAVMQAENGSGGRVTALTGDEPLLTDYLWDEVLAQQDPQTRDFLVRTSLLGELSGDLADALTGGAGGESLLARLSRENSFVTQAGEGEAYRYHPLLREVLTAELNREYGHEIPALLRRAASWYSGAGRPLEAVRCAAAADDWDLAAEALVAAGADAVMTGGPAELESVLGLFPARWAAGDVTVAAAWASARLWSGDLAGTASYLDSADRALPRAGEDRRRVAEPTLAALRVMCAAGTGRGGQLAERARHGRAIAVAAQASAATAAEHRAAGLLWFALGVTSLARWDTADAREALGHADRQLGAGGLTALRARARAWLALALACCGELTAAQQAADEARKHGAPSVGTAHGRQASFLAALAFAQINLGRDDLMAAQRLLDEVDQSRVSPLPGEPPVPAIAQLLRAKVLLADGDPAAAAAGLGRLRDTWLAVCPGLSAAVTVAEAEVSLRAGDTGRARALLLLADGDGPGRGDATLAEGSLMLAEGDFAGALETVRPYLATPAAGMAATGTAGPFGPAPPPGEDTASERIGALLVAGVARRRLGEGPAAAALVETALGLAEPEAGYRVFLDGGAAVRSAITVLVPPTSRFAGFAGRVLERFDTQGSRLASAPGAAEVRLTDSERAVLCFLPSHMTNEEISQALFLSVNTVKTHLRSAYRKLGVGSRREAIARGRRLGLL